MRVVKKKEDFDNADEEDLNELDWDLDEVKQGPYCLCRGPDNGSPMICCDTCNDWFHLRCVKISVKAARTVDKYVCPNCSPNLSPNSGNQSTKSMENEFFDFGDENGEKNDEAISADVEPFSFSTTNTLLEQKFKPKHKESVSNSKDESSSFFFGNSDSKTESKHVTTKRKILNDNISIPRGKRMKISVEGSETNPNSNEDSVRRKAVDNFIEIFGKEHANLCADIEFALFELHSGTVSRYYK